MKKLSWNRKLALIGIAALIIFMIYTITHPEPFYSSPAPPTSGKPASGSLDLRPCMTSEGTLEFIPMTQSCRCAPLSDCSLNETSAFCCYDITEPGALCTFSPTLAICGDNRCKAPNNLICESGVNQGPGVSTYVCCDPYKQLCVVDKNLQENCKTKCNLMPRFMFDGWRSHDKDKECWGKFAYSRDFVCCPPEAMCFADKYGKPSCSMVA